MENIGGFVGVGVGLPEGSAVGGIGDDRKQDAGMIFNKIKYNKYHMTAR